jgi:hypothetical protein
VLFPCFRCQSQKIRSTCAWWSQKMGSNAAVRTAVMSPPPPV